MAIYSNLQIREALQDGRIICQPFLSDHLGYASLDITLGHYYYQFSAPQNSVIYNPFSQTAVERQFTGPFKAMDCSSACREAGLALPSGIAADHPVIVIRPGQTYIVHSHEFVGILPPGAGHVTPRSSWSRNSLIVSGGILQPGFMNRLALSIFNPTSQAVILPVGERLAQVTFEDTGEVDGKYGELQTARDKYQYGNDLETIIKSWAPEQLLPRSYEDQRKLPADIEGLIYE